MTEIRWILELLDKHKLPPAAKKMCLDRIGYVEESLVSKMVTSPMIRPATTEQAPSTQRLMDLHASPMVTAPIQMLPITQRIVGGEVNTGNGTKGPRKF